MAGNQIVLKKVIGVHDLKKIKYILSKFKSKRVKDIKFTDIIALAPMTLALLIKPFYKTKYGGTWLICEESSAARDNGYHFLDICADVILSRSAFMQ